MGPPDPDGAGDIGRCDPLAVGRESGDGGRVSVLGVDGDIERIVEVHENDGSAIGVEELVGFGVAGDQNPSASFR